MNANQPVSSSPQSTSTLTMPSPTLSPSPSRSRLSQRSRNSNILHRFRLRNHANQQMNNQDGEHANATAYGNTNRAILNDDDNPNECDDKPKTTKDSRKVYSSNHSSKSSSSFSSSSSPHSSSPLSKKGKGLKRFINRKKNNSRRMKHQAFRKMNETENNDRDIDGSDHDHDANGNGNGNSHNDTSHHHRMGTGVEQTQRQQIQQPKHKQIQFSTTTSTSMPTNKNRNTYNKDDEKRKVLRDLNHYPMGSSASSGNGTKTTTNTTSTSTASINKNDLIQKKKRKSLDANAGEITTLSDYNGRGSSISSSSSSSNSSSRLTMANNGNTETDHDFEIQMLQKYDAYGSGYHSNNNNGGDDDDNDDGNESDVAVNSQMDEDTDYGDSHVINGGKENAFCDSICMDDEESGSLVKRFRNTNYSRIGDDDDDDDDDDRTTSSNSAPLPFMTIEINTSPSKNRKDVETSEDSSLSPKYSRSSSSVDHSFYFDDDDDADAMNEDDEEEEDDDDDDESESSCASTVVNDKPPRLVRPPPSATQEEQAKFYWELCYGKDTRTTDLPIKSWSANRKPPAKSCLSAKKIPWTEIAQSTSKRSVRRNNHLMYHQKSTPTACDHFHFQQDEKSAHNPSPMEKDGVISFNSHDTPVVKTPQSNDDSGMKSVKFGDASAAEFEASRPTVELTPLPSDKVRERFPVEEEDVESDDESRELHHETARNGARLALWEDDFDDYIDEDIDMNGDCSEEEDHSEERTIPNTKRDRRQSNSSRRSDRRSSVYFSRGGGSLVEDGDSKNEGSRTDDSPVSGSKKQVDDPSGIAIDESKFSPVSRNSIQSLSTRASEFFRLSTSDSDNSTRNSLQFSSPSASSSYRLSTSDSDTSKVTPKADVNSSSLLLRSVHSAGGASMGRHHSVVHDDITQDLKPSQLDITLREAEGNEYKTERNSSHNTSMIDKIINSEISTCDSSTLTTHHFGSLLRERSNYFSYSYDIAVSALLNNILNKMEVHSHVNISEAICEILQSKSPAEANIGKNDVAEVLNMSVSFLEQELLTMKDCDTKETRRLGGFLYQNFDSEERTELYSLLVEAAFSNWERLESQALETVSSCFHLINQSNCEEEVILRNLIGKVGDESNQNMGRRKTKYDLHTQTMIEMEALEELESRIYEEERELKHLSHLSSFWASKVEVEMNAPVVAIDYVLLDKILTFNEKLLMLDKVDISYPHLDGHSSETIVSWSSSHQCENDRRQSLSSIDSSLSSEGMMDLLTTTPTIHRIKKAKTSCDDPLPRGCAAYKLYTAILDSDYMTRSISDFFKQEQETGILVVTDVFQRLNLLAMDVMELHKYYGCRVERPPRSTSIILHVTISLGVSFSIGIRFTYDLSIGRTILYSVPSGVFIFPITGEPAVPINMLLRLAEHTIFNEPISNAFLLKRTCSALVDTLQGRDVELA